MEGLPRTAAARASPMPVLPEDGSMIVVPGLRTPSFSASRIIRAPMRSLTEPPGLKNSHFTSGMEQVTSRLYFVIFR